MQKLIIKAESLVSDQKAICQYLVWRWTSEKKPGYLVQRLFGYFPLQLIIHVVQNPMLEIKRRTRIRLKLPNMLPYPRDALVQEKRK